MRRRADQGEKQSLCGGRRKGVARENEIGTYAVLAAANGGDEVPIVDEATRGRLFAVLGGRGAKHKAGMGGVRERPNRTVTILRLHRVASRSFVAAKTDQKVEVSKSPRTSTHLCWPGYIAEPMIPSVNPTANIMNPTTIMATRQPEPHADPKTRPMLYSTGRSRGY